MWKIQNVTHDVIVVGLGAMGSAALYHLTRQNLARQNIRVLGLERFEPGHERGSSHGRTRIIRHGYFEHPSYVPLVRRAAAMWRELEQQSGQSLMTVTGIAEIGNPDSELIKGTLAASREHELPHEILTARELMKLYPAFRIPEDFVAVLQPDGGFVQAEAGIRAHLRLAAAAGAEIHTGERVVAIEQFSTNVRVTTERGTFEAGSVIVSAGAWTKSLLPGLNLPLQATRQVLLWVKPAQPDLFRVGWFPVFMIESEDGIHYGFPLHAEDGLKIAKHHHAGEIVDPDSYDRTVSPADEASIMKPIHRFLPASAGPIVSARTCLYTMAPDEDFVIDRAPGQERIIVASPCSGHGFKFAPAIGQALAELALRGKTSFDLSRFRIGRFT
ncbi:N-methyltryptophan oxidase [Pseudorhodoplanes sinuspersici]|uniref:N-methyltryptophan oxidase n=1 Tax=Pseudorhodoplanes sinuspersici TaxID=1235591 RepID=A0A1W7A057_9HYPH|nr:N-methyltryptophan oxidase [Pseudorhodoplanes sinuspersici]